ncbi:28012_t:CDS:2 [Gigaspora margarita]|uniref:28012_t:CDS:1 n=1 Tax=Gigaspora margarita TaxID=4874 RepID=A0ABN7V6S8_GIGMA|nr:28012_t:CDS:2 [Gigaspora margarita]
MYNSSQRNQYYNGSSDNNSGFRVDRLGGYVNVNYEPQVVHRDFSQRGQEYTSNGGNRGNYSNNRSNKESRSAAAGAWRTRTKDDEDDDTSLGSSVYSQPSVLGDGNPNLRRQNTTESRRQEPLYEDEQEFTNNYEPLEYPPSPHAASTTTRGSTAALTSGITQQPLYDQHENNNNMMDQQYYQNQPEQFDVYNDFNNNLRPHNYDEETASNPSNAALAGSNAYSKNNFNGKDHANRDLPGGNSDEKVILSIGIFFVWPRIPSFSIPGDKTSPSTSKTPTFRVDSSPIVDMDFTVTAMVDNRDNWLPFYFKNISVQYFDPSNSRSIGGGVVKDFRISSRSLSSVNIPLSILYQPSLPDGIVTNYATACTTPTNATGNRQTLLSATLNLQMFIFGLDWIYKPTTSITISDLKCPYEVPLSTSSTSSTSQ